jgi:hypothetical protein
MKFIVFFLDRVLSAEECFRTLKLRSQRVLKKHCRSEQLFEFDRILNELASGNLLDSEGYGAPSLFQSLFMVEPSRSSLQVAKIACSVSMTPSLG